MIKMSSKAVGLTAGAVAAVTYGMNPLFAVPLAAEGFSTEAILFIRFSFSALLIGLLLAVKRESFVISRKEILLTVPAGLLFASSAFSLYLSYRKMDSGVASTLLFVYPFLTALLMWLFFKEKLAFRTIISMLIAFAGIMLLCRQSDGSVISISGIVLVFSSALTYSIYMILINRSSLQTMPIYKYTFYSILTSAVFFGILLITGHGHFGEFTQKANLCCIGIVLFPTIISLITTTISIKHVGATITAVLGSLESATAVMIGVTILGEQMSMRLATGVILVLTAVILIALKK